MTKMTDSYSLKISPSLHERNNILGNSFGVCVQSFRLLLCFAFCQTMVELKKQLLSIFLPRAINTTIVENLKKNKRNGCYVCCLFCVIPSRSHSLSLGKPVQTEDVCKETSVKCQPCPLLNPRVGEWGKGGKTTFNSSPLSLLTVL